MARSCSSLEFQLLLHSRPECLIHDRRLFAWIGKRLRAIKQKYDPSGLFFIHHGVGSEDWSGDGFYATDQVASMAAKNNCRLL